MKKLFLMLLAVVVFSESCQNTSPAPSSTLSESNQKDDSAINENGGQVQLQNPSLNSTTLLIFKKEKKFELWSDNNLVVSFYCASANIERMPIGTFSVSEKNKKLIALQFPNSFYANKKQSLTSLWDNDARLRLNEVCYKNRIKSIINSTHIWVFPNDARTSSSFDPCFACPHWTAELHSRLYLLLNQFPTPTDN